MTTTTTIVGRIADEIGGIRQHWLEQGRHTPELRHRTLAAGANDYRPNQPQTIDLEYGHQRSIGVVRHLERRHGRLWAVAEVHDPATVPPSAVYFSPTIAYLGDVLCTDIELRSLSLVENPGTIGQPRVHELFGDLRHACRDAWRLHDPLLTTLLGNALANKAGTTRIHEDHPPTPRPDPVEQRADARARGRGSGRWVTLPTGERVEVEIRDWGRVTHVNGRPVGAH